MGLCVLYWFLLLSHCVCGYVCLIVREFWTQKVLRMHNSGKKNHAILLSLSSFFLSIFNFHISFTIHRIQNSVCILKYKRLQGISALQRARKVLWLCPDYAYQKYWCSHPFVFHHLFNVQLFSCPQNKRSLAEIIWCTEFSSRKVLYPSVLPLNTESRFLSLSESPGNTGVYTLQMELPPLWQKQIQCRFTAGLLEDGLQPKYPDFDPAFYILKFLSNYFYK